MIVGYVRLFPYHIIVIVAQKHWENRVRLPPKLKLDKGNRLQEHFVKVLRVTWRIGSILF